MLPALLIEGGTTRTALYYLAEILLPALSQGQLLILDNDTAHHGGRVEELARAAGVGLHYLPSYSPDLNPIEHMFRKLKAYLRKAAAVTFSSLSRAIKDALDAVTLPDIQGFLSTLGFKRQEP